MERYLVHLFTFIRTTEQVKAWIRNSEANARMGYDSGQLHRAVPDKSQVGAQAVRELDTVPTASRLVTLLSEFDDLF